MVEAAHGGQNVAEAAVPGAGQGMAGNAVGVGRLEHGQPQLLDGRVHLVFGIRGMAGGDTAGQVGGQAHIADIHHARKNEGVLVHFAAAMLTLVVLIGPDAQFHDRVNRHVRGHMGGKAEKPGRRLGLLVGGQLEDLRHTAAQQAGVARVVHRIGPFALASLEREIRVVGADGAQFHVFQIAPQAEQRFLAQAHGIRQFLGVVDHRDMGVGSWHANS